MVILFYRIDVGTFRWEDKPCLLEERYICRRELGNDLILSYILLGIAETFVIFLLLIARRKLQTLKKKLKEAEMLGL